MLTRYCCYLALWLLPLLVPLQAAEIPAVTPHDRWVSLDLFTSRYGFILTTETEKELVLANRAATLTLHPRLRLAILNGTRFYLNAPLTANQGIWHLALADVQSTLLPLLISSRFVTVPRKPVVVLDPGHGGKDQGATGAREVQEKRVVLDVAKRTQRKLAAQGITALLTRNRDVYLSLNQRTAYAAKRQATVFVSIHANASANTSAQGVETFVLPMPGFHATGGNSSSTNAVPGNDFDQQNLILAYQLQQSLLQHSGGQDRGVRRARYQVLVHAPCPAALVEFAFISNPQEEEKMLRPEYRQSVADGIAQGITRYLTIGN